MNNTFSYKRCPYCRKVVLGNRHAKYQNNYEIPQLYHCNNCDITFVPFLVHVYEYNEQVKDEWYGTPYAKYTGKRITEIVSEETDKLKDERRLITEYYTTKNFQIYPVSINCCSAERLYLYIQKYSEEKLLDKIDGNVVQRPLYMLGTLESYMATKQAFSRNKYGGEIIYNF